MINVKPWAICENCDDKEDLVDFIVARFETREAALNEFHNLMDLRGSGFVYRNYGIHFLPSERLPSIFKSFNV